MSERGYSLVELLVSATILLAVFASICRLATPAHATAMVQAELQDMQQRARLVADRLTHDLWLAGAGTSSGPRRGPLWSYFAPILPAACCGPNADPPGSAFTDRITITYVPRDAPEARTASDIAPDSLRLDLAAGPSCSASAALCGFADGDLLVVFGDSGAYDTFRLDLSSGLPILSPRASPFTARYIAGSTVARIVTRTYYRDASSNQLMVVDGDGSQQPIVDRVTALRFEYRDDADMLLDTAFTDGPWNGAGGTMYDADLLRVRRVRVTYTIRSALPAAGSLSIPDLTSTIDVAPRNAGSGT